MVPDGRMVGSSASGFSQGQPCETDPRLIVPVSGLSVVYFRSGVQLRQAEVSHYQVFSPSYGDSQDQL